MNFKNFDEYKKLRDSFIADAEKLLGAAKKGEYEAKVKEIEKLDNDFEAFRTEQANLNALRNKAPQAPTADFMNKHEKVDNTVITDVFSTAEYRNGYLKTLQGKPLTDMENAAVSGGSSIIPTQTMNKIIGILEESPILSRIDMTFIPSNISYPMESSAADASWIAMSAASTDSADSFSAVSLGAYKLIKTIEISADVQAMSIDAFENWLVARLANKMEKACDNAVLNGTGSNQPTGILKSGEVATTGTYTKSGMTYKDLIGILAALASAYANNAVLITTRKTFFGEILGITSTGGDKIVVADAQSPAKFNVLGYPVIVDDNCPEGTVVFGDLSAYKFNFAQSPAVERDTSVGFRTGSTVYRAMALADGKLSDSKALVVYTKATA